MTLLHEFLTVPSLADFEAQYLWVPEEHPRKISISKFDDEKLADLLVPVLERYFAGLDGEIPPEESVCIERLAYRYAGKKRSSDAWYKDAECILTCTRLKLLLRNPRFLKDPAAEAMMIALADLQENCPWSWDFWLDCKRKRYFLMPGFGREHIPALQQFIDCNPLWRGHSESLHKYFFSSIGQVLSLLSTGQGLLTETLEPRMDLISRNRGYGNYLDVWIAAAFLQEELARLRELALDDRSLQERLRVIEADEMFVAW